KILPAERAADLRFFGLRIANLNRKIFLKKFERTVDRAHRDRHVIELHSNSLRQRHFYSPFDVQVPERPGRKRTRSRGSLRIISGHAFQNFPAYTCADCVAREIGGTSKKFEPRVELRAVRL